MYKAHSIIFS